MRLRKREEGIQERDTCNVNDIEAMMHAIPMRQRKMFSKRTMDEDNKIFRK